MAAFIIRRLGNAVIVMLVVCLAAFLVFQFLGDPVEMMLNEQATQAERGALRDRLRSDRPAMAQFTRFVLRAAKGDFGIS
jgi:peptide/nickel transport system permease protein